jgi:hypothetical protein
VGDELLWVPSQSQAAKGDLRYEWGADALSVSSCSRPAAERSWRILSEKDQGDSLLLNVAATGKTKPQVIAFEKSKEIYRGVAVETYAATDHPNTPAEFRGSLMFRRPTAPNLALGLGAWDHCGTEGFVPGHLNIVFDPTQKEAFTNWVAENVRAKRLVLGTDGSPFTLSDKYTNAAQVFMQIGEEPAIFRDLKAQPWTIDYAMVAYPMEPDLHVWLPASFLPIDGNKTQASQAALRQALSAAFPQLKATQMMLTQRQATSFDVNLSAPMQRVLPDNQTYYGYWLVMTLRVQYYVERRGEKINWAGVIHTGDGFLPKRPADAAPPLPDSYLNYQLSEVGAPPFRNSALMGMVQERLLQEHVCLFNGELKGD